MPLTWDFSRQLDAAASPGNTTSYYDEACQSFYLDSGTIRTRIAQLDDGQWQDIEPEDELIISETGYSALDIEHHYNGAVAGSAQHDTAVVFLLYEYMKDVSTWLQNGTHQQQPDNPIKVGSFTLKNADMAVFEDNAYTLFGPGNRLTFKYRAGDSEFFDMGQIYIEGSPYADIAESFTFQGRNLLGFYLASQTFDDKTTYTGTLTAIFTEMLTDAGVPATMMLIQTSSSSGTFTFNPTDTYLAGLEAATKMADWYFDDLPSGKIVIGDATFMRDNAARTGIYSFNRGSEVFSRTVDRTIDGVYSRACVQRNGPSPLRIYANVPYYDGWFVAAHKTFYQTVPDTTTQADMERILAQLVEGLQYSGVTERFSSPFRPWLQTGDVGLVTGGDSPRLAGIITDIQQQFGQDGFFTEFTIASGGTISNPDNELTVASKYVGKMGGANRQRRILDFIKDGISAPASSSQVGAVTYQAAVAGGYLGDEQTMNENLAKVADGAVLPAGGTEGQQLVKASGDDYDAAWADKSIWGGM